MNRTILIFGLLAGTIVSALQSFAMLLAKGNRATFDWGMVIGYASMLLAFSLIFVATRSYRDRYRQGTLSFGQGFRIGLGITLIASVLYTLTWVVVYKTVYPEYPQEYRQYTLEKMRSEGKSAAEISATAKQLSTVFADYDTWYVLLGYTFLEIFPVGLLVSLLSALILKRKPAPGLSRAG
ncbi:MAG: DUF4199 domain-containing protein [Cytophagaceae bacterium]|nr:DUF4199 domain-containing protein [Cytophagaceae bacterium]